MVFASSGVPTEVWLEIACAMGEDATIQDWINVELVCGRWGEDPHGLFGEWLRSQKEGCAFCMFGGSEAETLFVLRYLDGE